MKKKNIFLSIFVIMILVLSGTLFFLRQEKKDGSVKEEERKRIEQIGVDIFQDKNFQNTTRQAISLNDVAICNKLENEEKQKYCIDRVHQEQVKSSSNAEDCNALLAESDRDDCYYSMAIKKKEIDLCDQIGDERYKISCKNHVYQESAKTSSEISECLKIFDNEFAKKDCLIGIFSDFTDVSQCDTILKDPEKQYCRDILQVRQAYFDENKDPCTNVLDAGLKAYCDGTGEYFLQLNQRFDKDGDGLDGGQESMVRTSDDTRDTDKDGYDDYTEIVNGYNPLGEGKYSPEEHQTILKKIDF